MKKVFLLVVSILCLTACSQKEEFKIGELPGSEEIKISSGYGVYIQFKGTDKTILYSGNEGAFMFINGKIEGLEFVGEEDVWGYKNETYKVIVNVKTSKDEEEGLPVYDGEISVTNLKNNISKIIKVDGYLAK